MTKKVIIIDDSITSLNLLKNKFASFDWEVYGATSAKDGYEMIFDVAPDIIITDAIMPFMGGFQFIKLIRENEKASKIPIIVYSVLPENNAKFYIKEECLEYFLPKKDNVDELMLLAETLTNEHPIDEDQRLEILKSKFDMAKLQDNDTPAEPDKKPEIEENTLSQKLKEKYNFTYSDEKILSEFFSVLYPVLNYELCVVFPQQAHKKEKSIFFDIRDIIVSPIFQNKIAEKYGAGNVVLFKKYAPNLKMITNEEEFASKIEFHFDYKDKPIADMVFYSKERSKWDNEEETEIVRNVVHEFFKAYFINKNNSMPQKDDFNEKYFGEKFNILNKQEMQNKDKNAFVGIISISNYSEFSSNYSGEDIDILNSKISEKIIGCLENDEQVIKNDEDEYSVVINVKDEKSALSKFDFIINTLEQIEYEGFKVEALIGASSCIIDGSYNVFEAQKNAYEALDNASNTEKTVIYNAAE